jgi:hypothetical protein
VVLPWAVKGEVRLLITSVIECLFLPEVNDVRMFSGG